MEPGEIGDRKLEMQIGDGKDQQHKLVDPTSQ